MGSVAVLDPRQATRVAAAAMETRHPKTREWWSFWSLQALVSWRLGWPSMLSAWIPWLCARGLLRVYCCDRSGVIPVAGRSRYGARRRASVIALTRSKCDALYARVNLCGVTASTLRIA